MTDNKQLDKLQGLLDVARTTLREAAYTYTEDRNYTFNNKGITELEQAAIDFSYAKFKHDEWFPVEIKTSAKDFVGTIKVDFEGDK